MRSRWSRPSANRTRFAGAEVLGSVVVPTLQDDQVVAVDEID